MRGIYYEDYDKNMLKDFDKKLRRYEDVYTISNGLKIKPFQYVKIWRHRGYSIPLYLELFMKLRKILKHE